MKQDIENLLSRLASKELTFGCELHTPSGRAKYIRTFESPKWEYPRYLFWYQNECGAFTSDNASVDCKILGYPIFIGDVLEKIGFGWAKKAVDEHLHNTGWILEKAQADLLKLWQPLGFTKSLQSIFNSVEWEGVCKLCGKQGVANRIRTGDFHVCEASKEIEIVEVPKQKAVRELFEFLLQIFPNETN